MKFALSGGKMRFLFEMEKGGGLPRTVRTKFPIVSAEGFSAAGMYEGAFSLFLLAI